MTKDYNCSPNYWDNIAIQEVVQPQGIAERYTQTQCLVTIKRALHYLNERALVTLLKTDLWTEGIVRNREILSQITTPNFAIHSIDISHFICKRAASYSTPATIIQATITALPYRDHVFDMILDLSTIDHVNFTEAQNALAEYKRCLKTDGVLALMFAPAGGVFAKQGRGQDYFTFQPKAVKDTLRQLEFRILEEYAIHLMNILPFSSIMTAVVAHNLPKFPVAIIKRLEYSRLSRYLKYFAPMYVIIARNGTQ